MRRIALVTVGRSDYGLYLPLLRELGTRPHVATLVVVGGAHLSAAHGYTVARIEADGIAIAWKAEMTTGADSPAAVSASMGTGTREFSRAFDALRPDLIVVLGDRYDMHAAAVAAVPFRIPVAHIHGGELTEGAIDDLFRHSMTKLSHLHFVATDKYGARVRQMGEESWRVSVVGALSVDNARALERPDRHEFLARYHLDPAREFALVTLHPTTLDLDDRDPASQADVLIDALGDPSLDVVYTQPNADAGGRAIEERFDEFRRREPDRVTYVPDFGPHDYLTAMACASVMVGNSSSGLIEAPAFRLPVVNIGSRQDRRMRAANVVDVPFESAAIAAGIRRARSPEFLSGRDAWGNPYGDGHAARRIADVLEHVPLDGRLRHKRFVDRPADASDRQAPAL